MEETVKSVLLFLAGQTLEADDEELVPMNEFKYFLETLQVESFSNTCRGQGRNVVMKGPRHFSFRIGMLMKYAFFYSVSMEMMEPRNISNGGLSKSQDEPLLTQALWRIQALHVLPGLGK